MDAHLQGQIPLRGLLSHHMAHRHGTPLRFKLPRQTIGMYPAHVRSQRVSCEREAQDMNTGLCRDREPRVIMNTEAGQQAGRPPYPKRIVSPAHSAPDTAVLLPERGSLSLVELALFERINQVLYRGGGRDHESSPRYAWITWGLEAMSDALPCAIRWPKLSTAI